MSITELRKKVDKLDERILVLLNERAKLSLAIGKVKSMQKANIYSPDREREVYRSVTSGNKGPLSNDSLRAVYGEIMSGCLALQMPSKIAYLGPSRTFTHIAALKKFGKSLNYLECSSIADVFTEVERDRAGYGVVPIENSTEGAVNYTLDMFIESDLRICSEVYLPIGHKLLSRHGKMSSIKKIYSHEQVFAQCRVWLEKNLPQAKLIPCSSTTEGAMYASAGKGGAAIASKLAAEDYGLNIIAASIEDSPHNITRFLVIGKHETELTGSDKTSVVFSMKDKIGVLHDALAPFKRNRINLTKIESRPSKKRPWEYYFFVDMEGHREDAKVKRALHELGKKQLYFKILGSYPKAS